MICLLEDGTVLSRAEVTPDSRPAPRQVRTEPRTRAGLTGGERFGLAHFEDRNRPGELVGPLRKFDEFDANITDIRYVGFGRHGSCWAGFEVRPGRREALICAIRTSAPTPVPMLQFSRRPWNLTDARQRPYDLWEHAMDHPGLMWPICGITKQYGVNIGTLLGHTYNAPVSAAPLFGAHFRLEVSSDVDIEAVAFDMKALERELGVIIVGPVPHDANWRANEPPWFAELLRSPSAQGYDVLYN